MLNSQDNPEDIEAPLSPTLLAHPEPSQFTVYRSRFKNLPTSFSVAEGNYVIFEEYKRISQFEGFRFMKHTSPTKIWFLCQNGRKQDSRRGKEQMWRIDTNFYDGVKLPQCPVRVEFDLNAAGTTFERGYYYEGHNHLRDQSIIPDTVGFYIDNFLAKEIPKMTGAEIVCNVKQRFPDYNLYPPSFFHHLRQRFDISFRSNVSLFGRGLLSEFLEDYPEEDLDIDTKTEDLGMDDLTTLVSEQLIDEFYTERVSIISRRMQKNYRIWGQRGPLFIHLYESAILEPCDFILFSGFSNDGSTLPFAVFLLKRGFGDYSQAFAFFKGFLDSQELEPPSTVFIPPHPEILKATLQRFSTPGEELGVFFQWPALREVTSKIFKTASTRIRQLVDDLLLTDLYEKSFVDLMVREPIDDSEVNWKLSENERAYLTFLDTHRSKWHPQFLIKAPGHFSLNISGKEEIRPEFHMIKRLLGCHIHPQSVDMLDFNFSLSGQTLGIFLNSLNRLNVYSLRWFNGAEWISKMKETQAANQGGPPHFLLISELFGELPLLGRTLLMQEYSEAENLNIFKDKSRSKTNIGESVLKAKATASRSPHRSPRKSQDSFLSESDSEYDSDSESTHDDTSSVESRAETAYPSVYTKTFLITPAVKPSTEIEGGNRIITPLFKRNQRGAKREKDDSSDMLRWLNRRMYPKRHRRSGQDSNGSGELNQDNRESSYGVEASSGELESGESQGNEIEAECAERTERPVDSKKSAKSGKPKESEKSEKWNSSDNSSESARSSEWSPLHKAFMGSRCHSPTESPTRSLHYDPPKGLARLSVPNVEPKETRERKDNLNLLASKAQPNLDLDSNEAKERLLLDDYDDRRSPESLEEDVENFLVDVQDQEHRMYDFLRAHSYNCIYSKRGPSSLTALYKAFEMGYHGDIFNIGNVARANLIIRRGDRSDTIIGYDCSCSLSDEYGGIPCRHVMKAALAQYIDLLKKKRVLRFAYSEDQVSEFLQIREEDDDRPPEALLNRFRDGYIAQEKAKRSQEAAVQLNTFLAPEKKRQLRSGKVYDHQNEGVYFSDSSDSSDGCVKRRKAKAVPQLGARDEGSEEHNSVQALAMLQGLQDQMIKKSTMQKQMMDEAVAYSASQSITQMKGRGKRRAQVVFSEDKDLLQAGDKQGEGGRKGGKRKKKRESDEEHIPRMRKKPEDEQVTVRKSRRLRNLDPHSFDSKFVEKERRRQKQERKQERKERRQVRMAKKERKKKKREKKERRRLREAGVDLDEEAEYKDDEEREDEDERFSEYSSEGNEKAGSDQGPEADRGPEEEDQAPEQEEPEPQADDAVFNFASEEMGESKDDADQDEDAPEKKKKKKRKKRKRATNPEEDDEDFDPGVIRRTKRRKKDSEDWELESEVNSGGD